MSAVFGARNPAEQLAADLVNATTASVSRSLAADVVVVIASRGDTLLVGSEPKDAFAMLAVLTKVADDLRTAMAKALADAARPAAGGN